MVRAKMRFTGEESRSWGNGMTPVNVLHFTAQYDPAIPEDQKFQKATPSAHAEFQIDNPAAVAQFKLGEDYYLDFSPVPK